MNDLEELLKQLEQAYTNPSCIEREKAKRYYDAINNLLGRYVELETEVEHLKDEIKNLEQDIEDNYIAVPVAEQVGINDNDFI